MNKILVVGSSGLVGSKFVSDASKKASVIGVDEKNLDITDSLFVEKYFKKNNDNFDVVVNFAAYTDVDGAEKQRGDKNGLAWKLNVVGVENLISVCKKYKKHLIQISTDFVFPGTSDTPGPYDELHSVSSILISDLSWYGWTKAKAEERIRNYKLGSIVRIAYPFYADNFEKKLDFAKNYLKLFDEGKLFPIFTDQTFSALLVDQLIDPIIKIGEEKMRSVFHVVSANTATPFEFVEYLLKKARDAEGVVKKGSMKEFLSAKGRTPRPRLGGLKTEKTEEVLGIKFKTWQEMVDEFVSKLK